MTIRAVCEFMTLAFSAQGGVHVTGEMKPILALDRIRNEKPESGRARCEDAGP
jgi:hypothetical protein